MRVVVADDDPLILELIREMLSEACDVVAEAGDGQSLVDAVAQHAPDIAVVDVSMPGLNGIEATRLLRDQGRSVRVVMLSVHDQPAYVEAAFAAGARGYVLKFAANLELIQAIRAVASDRLYLSTELR